MSCRLGLPAMADDGPVRAARGLAQRILPEYAERFAFEVIAPDAGRDVFELSNRNAMILIRGNNAVSMATGLNWYLKHYCNCQISLQGRQLRLPDALPPVTSAERIVSWAKRRYYLNYCCFGYSLPWWNWEQWERLIDWMALNGINMPLSVTGQEAVWQAVCRRLGMRDEEIMGFLAGPPYLPFQWMGCLDGWGAPLPARWIEQHETLQRQILGRERELGMTPVLQGFTGHVPPAIVEKHPDARLHKIHWIEWDTCLLDPLDPLFQTIGDMFIEEQTQRFGTDHLYAADTFIEMQPPRGELDYLDRLSKAIYSGMAARDPQAVWVLQGWTFMNQRHFWSQPRVKAFLDAVPADRMAILDLFCETHPVWSETKAFYGKPWLWCNVQTFGDNVHLGGALERNNTGLMDARNDPNGGTLAGLGFVNEGLGYNPIVDEQLFEMAWRNQATDLATWTADFARRRYGQPDADAEAAWHIMLTTVYTAPHRRGGIIDTMPATRTAGVPYNNARLAEAWRRLLQAADRLGDRDTYRFDLVNVARQVLSNHAAALHHETIKAYNAKDATAFAETSRRFLGLIDDLDELLATRGEFLLGRWLADAVRWGDTDEERNRMEWNARRVITRWGHGTAINDYARKEWAGMMAGYYRPRWSQYFDALAVALQSDSAFDAPSFNRKLAAWCDAWCDGHERYATAPKGDSVAVARRLWRTYGETAFVPNARSLTTDKPATCSHALPPYPAALANDGWSNNTDAYWATDVTQHPGEAWWQVDLLQPTTVGRVVVVAYYGDTRYYGFTVETSLDGNTWTMAADRRDNREPSTANGYTCRFPPRQARYIRVTQTSNSANSGRHLVEVMAYEE